MKIEELVKQYHTIQDEISMIDSALANVYEIRGISVYSTSRCKPLPQPVIDKIVSLLEEELKVREDKLKELTDREY